MGVPVKTEADCHNSIFFGSARKKTGQEKGQHWIRFDLVTMTRNYISHPEFRLHEFCNIISKKFEKDKQKLQVLLVRNEFLAKNSVNLEQIYVQGGQYHASRGTRKVIMTPINPNPAFE